MDVQLIDWMGDDLRVVNAARVSFNKWKNEFDDLDRRLLRYLCEHHHDSPFFHPQICFRIEAPIYVARQLFRHEVGGAKNEVSRRYVTEEVIIELPDTLRWTPGKDKKQGSGPPMSWLMQRRLKMAMQESFNKSIAAYEHLLESGVAPEQARIVLPLALQTKWIWTGSLAFYHRVCRDRMSNDAQEETRLVANLIDTHLREIFPVSWPLLLGETNLVEV